jgi:hypothetical protein
MESSVMNPYNFVRLQEMATGARQIPVPHSAYTQEHAGQPVFSGRLTCTLTTFSPTMILSHTPQDFHEQNEHKIFRQFFHRPDDVRPMIPATSLKGMARAIAEAASNSCLSVIQEAHGARWPNILSGYPPSLHFCGRGEANPYVLPDNTDGPPSLCPACRIFGTAPQQESGGSRAGLYPRAFQGKARFHDAHLVSDLAQAHDREYTLIALLEPKLSQKVWYYDTRRGSSNHPLAGRKFYYHHDTLEPLTGPRSRFNSTIRPVRAGAIFLFHVDFRNLTDYELDLLVYSLQLEPALQLVVERELTLENGQRERHRVFDHANVRRHPGVYPKLGYGKAAGLGSVCLLVSRVQRLDPIARYTGDEGWQLLTPAQVVDLSQGAQARMRFVHHGNFQHIQTENHLADLRQILRFPNGLGQIRYPTLKEFGVYKERRVKLPLPGQENNWR